MQKIHWTWIKRSIIALWMLLLVSWFSYFLMHPEFFTAIWLSQFLLQFWGWLLFVYFILSALRGFTLIPSTPFVLVGLILFPGHLHFVYLISMVGILISATMVYFFSREMGFEEVLLWHNTKRIKKYEAYVEKYGFPFVCLWSFLIIVPTDLICYIAGTMKMPFYKFISAVAIGEGLICVFLIYGGDLLTNYIRTLL